MKNGQKFWNKEYAKPGHLSLSSTPSEDLEKFCRWLSRQDESGLLNFKSSVVDVGCGNGRNIIYLAENFNVQGIGIDISSEAIRQAKNLSQNLHIQFQTGSIAQPLAIEDSSQTLVLDMMVSHVLSHTERSFFFSEIFRVLKPGGFFLYKTFLLDEDTNAKRLLKEFPGEEPNSYIHPEIKVREYVFTEQQLHDQLKDIFYIRKSVKSFRHRGRAAKRRSITFYAQKN